MADVTLTRGRGFADDFPDLTGWSEDVAGGSFTLSGGIVTFSRISGVPAWKKAISPTLASATYKALGWRVKAIAGTFTAAFEIRYTDLTTEEISVENSQTTWKFLTGSLTQSKTIDQVRIKFTGASTGSTLLIDLVMIHKELLNLPVVNQPMGFSNPRVLVELPILRREGGVLQDLGSMSTVIQCNGGLFTTTTPNNYTAVQWVQVLLGTWLEANWQVFSSELWDLKVQIEFFQATPVPGRKDYFDFVLRIRKHDPVAATADSWGAIQ